MTGSILSSDAALRLAMLAGVATLVAWGVAFSRHEGYGLAGIAGAASTNALVGMTIIGLKAVVA